MPNERPRIVGATIFVWLLACTRVVGAQSVEVSPFGGYLFGNDLFEVAAGRELDVDGAPALGIVVDVPLSSGLQFEAFVAHQEAAATVPFNPFRTPAPARISVDHWQGGALQVFGGKSVRPFLTGMLGLTRYAVEGDSEIRFALGTGGGVKLFPLRHVGVRLDGRVFATFVDADATVVACRVGSCLLVLHMNVAWQAVFTAGLTVEIP
jgi:hypothetical protein